MLEKDLAPLNQRIQSSAPVGTVTAGKAGAKNAALMAVAILALSDAELQQKLMDFRKAQTAQVEAADAELQASLAK
ncbi:MAG: AIR carboxylase family protein, partial [Lentisphaeria bacterium]|nr:AIR carboxylase family protein [Lentisphaeria bacterium]